ncbi:MAG: amidase, partial [Planctomycetia bacterium]
MDAPRLAAVVPTPDDPAFADVATLGGWLRDGKTTAVKLAAYFCDRLEKHGDSYGAVVTVTRERALREAAACDADAKAGRWRGPLHGIPYGAKDLLAAVGYPTTWGAAPYRNRAFDYDAVVVKKLHAAGAVLAAKLSMVEFAGGFGYSAADASFTGPGRSPWNRDAWAGGSSAGSGAAVAAGLVPFAIGSETWGSIVTPATYCGVVGLRPTYGRVSRAGAMALSWTMDKLGPLTLSAADAALVLTAIAGPDDADPTTLPQRFHGVEALKAAG